ncbi:MAG: 1,4-alpha-glucan branching protein GlgB [Clostridia bacterium]|nr:1,4-alpha-glucan branching protein GlgB [Clostridia bacterium]
MADVIAGYVKHMGYTHVELLPIAEHPFDGSWGYQVCGFYAPTSRFGTPDGFRYFVNTLHKAGVGVILDWVPAHFPKDEWGLYEFDGQPLDEYQGWDRMESRAWGTRFFDLGREEVQSFLISNALYFLREFHVDGLRVDAVTSMLYLDYDRMPWEWIPNVYGDNKNLEAIAFLRKLNDTVDREFPDALMIAEESTAFGGVTHPTAEGGLGFDLKWNMGFANDIFSYLAKEPVFRRYHHTALNFPILYAFGENYLLPISHDEVVHGKGSLIGKIAGSYEEKFATMRAFMTFLMSFPGKKMLFMGTEFAVFSEWWEARALEWFLLDYPIHSAFRDFIRELNHFYLSEPALYERDFTPDGFEWLLADEADKNLVAYLRRDGKGRALYAVISFSGAAQEVCLPMKEGRYTVVFDTGSGRGDKCFQTDEKGRLFLTLSPFEGLYLRAEDEESFFIS